MDDDLLMLTGAPSRGLPEVVRDHQFTEPQFTGRFIAIELNPNPANLGLLRYLYPEKRSIAGEVDGVVPAVRIIALTQISAST